MFLWGRFWFRRVAYGYERMSSLVPELVKKWCTTISAESNDSANVLKLAYRPMTSGHLSAMFAMPALAGNVAVAAYAA
ncbi:MAG: hypothetical protein QG604_128 [Candidatus Dependentiae bacterium]|nr:hypothetical protein [Candidatus Dependentiae bacterium]